MDKPVFDATKHAAVIQGMIDLAHWYEAHPEVPLPDLTVNNYVVSDFEATARALGSFEKVYSDDLFTIKKMFGPIKAQFFFMREQVCTKRVVGKRSVPAQTIEIPARDEEIVEWDCEPVLAPKV